jgi:hypothetical protein
LQTSSASSKANVENDALLAATRLTDEADARREQLVVFLESLEQALSALMCVP